MIFIAVFTALFSVLVLTRGEAQTSVPATYKATITVATSAAVTGQIGNQFIGLSFEESTLNRRYANVGNLPQLLRNLGKSVIRFGGDTADGPVPNVTPSVLRGLDKLAKATGWSVLYTENLAEFNRAQVKASAKEVSATLGGRLFAFACGNEPDLFPFTGIRSPDYSFADYLAQDNACLEAIRAGDPHAPLEGPDTANAPAWLAEYAAKEKGTISYLGQHYYPLGCATLSDSAPAFLPSLLSPKLAATEVTEFKTYAAAAKKAGVPLVIDEANSACGGGVRGLSNAYASALWVIDFMLTGAEHGVDGMNFHGGLNTLCDDYTVLCQIGPVNQRGPVNYSPQPIYYGMLLTHYLGAGGFLPVKIAKSASAANITAFAVRDQGSGRVRLIVENLGADQADATLRVGGYQGPASVLHLTGPAPLATSGVKIQGASVAKNGVIKPGRANATTCTSSGCPVTLAPWSAVLVTLG